MKKLVLGLTLGGFLLALVVQGQVGPRGDLYSARALQSLEQAFKTTGVLTFPNYAAAPVVCNAANLGVYYYDTTLADIRICGWAGWMSGGVTVGTANTIPKWNAAPDDLVDTYMVELAIPAAGAGGNILTQSGTMNALDNDDTLRLFYIDWLNVAHAGANNFIFGIDVDGIVQDDNATEVLFHAGDGWDIDLGFADADSLNIGPLGQSNLVTVYDVPATGTTGSLVEISATFDAMDGTIQTYRGLYITLIEPAPAGAISMVHGIDIASLNAIGYILDSAIYVDSGWLADIRFNEPAAHVVWAEGGSLEFSDWSIWEGLTTPGDPHNQVIFRDAAADNAAPLALVEIDPLLSIMDGAGDIQRVLYLDIDNVNHTNGTVYGIDIDTVVADPDATEAAIRLDASWDYALLVEGTTQELDHGLTTAVMLSPTLAANDNANDIRNVLTIDVDIPNGTNGLINAVNIDAVTDDANTIDSAIFVEGGWDFALTIAETGHAATCNPLTGTVGFFLDDSVDYSGGGGNDCWLIVRDNAGTNHMLLQIVLDGACP